MCGFTGLLCSDGLARDELRTLLARMTATLRHRGPDHEGSWCSVSGDVGLGFRRLAILDLSPSGNQPMVSSRGRFVIAFNGEIYNYADLRGVLCKAGHIFTGTSDTEVMLAAIEHWGVATAVEKFWGMFAFALWDIDERLLYLARDRLGKKPLYYGWQGRFFLFGSELKALRAHPSFDAAISPDAVASYAARMYVPGELSIFAGIEKVPPGSLLTVNVNLPGVEPRRHKYWDVSAAVTRALGDPMRDTREADDVLHALLLDSVRRRMIADVPLGAFLSGGIDSSLIVALMQEVHNAPVRTFTIGFREREYDESSHAAAVASHLRTDHTTLWVDTKQARDLIPRLPAIFDEPFADASQIPTYLVSALAKQHVTVALSGDGGDELFGGYNRYLLAERLRGILQWMSPWLRRAGAWAALAVPAGFWDAALGAVRAMRPGTARSISGDRIHKLAGALSQRGEQNFYRALASAWYPVEQVVPNGREKELPTLDGLSGTHLMMYIDLVTYLVDDILVKVDRATMAASLEARAPLLDHRVVELAWRFPIEQKVRAGRGKLPLRRLLKRYVPDDLIERPKMGFGLPLASWLRSDLRDWAEDLLSPDSLKASCVFDVKTVRAAWAEHLSGARNWQTRLWTVLMYQAWSRAPAAA